MTRQKTDIEASIFVRYYTGGEAPDAIKVRYAQYLSLYPLTLSTQDKKTLAFGLSSPWSIKLLDAGLAVINPQAELRRRLYVIFSLLESDKTYAHLFLSKKHSTFYIFWLGLVGCSAIAKMITGAILLKLVIR